MDVLSVTFSLFGFRNISLSEEKDRFHVFLLLLQTAKIALNLFEFYTYC